MASGLRTRLIARPSGSTTNDTAAPTVHSVPRNHGPPRRARGGAYLAPWRADP